MPERLGYISHNDKIIINIDMNLNVNVKCLSFLSKLKTLLLELLEKHFISSSRVINMTVYAALIQPTVFYFTLGVLSRDDVRKTEGVPHAQSWPVH